jgi:hypothetical protein
MEREISPRRGLPPAKDGDLEALFGLLRAPRERAAGLPMAKARMHAQPGARRRTPCGRCAVVVLQIKAASALSEEAGLPGRETGVRECAGVGLTEQQCLQQRRARVRAD